MCLVESRASADTLARFDAHVAVCEACSSLLAGVARARPSTRGETVVIDPRASEPPPEADASAVFAGLGSRLAQLHAERRVGTTLRDKWHIDGVLGMGGMAQVFSAMHRNGRKVAIKVLRPELAGKPEVVRRFLREGYVANRVGHPGAVAILDDDFTDEGIPFLVMDRLRGETLRERVHRYPHGLPVEEVLRCADAVLEVLSAAHGQGIVHRDIKPENLFLADDGSYRVLDFGIARVQESVHAAGATETGSVFGTPGFMAPEQARGAMSEIDARSDLWAVGATMHFALTGKLVHEGQSLQEEMFLAMTKPAPPILQVKASIPPNVASVVDRALAFDKARRWPDAAAMRDAVRAAAKQLGLDSASFDVANPVPKVQTWPLSAVVVAVVLVGAAVLVGVSSSSRTTTLATTVVRTASPDLSPPQIEPPPILPAGATPGASVASTASVPLPAPSASPKSVTRVETRPGSSSGAKPSPSPDLLDRRR